MTTGTMTSAEHRQVALDFLAASDVEFEAGDILQAAEKLWGRGGARGDFRRDGKRLAARKPSFDEERGHKTVNRARRPSDRAWFPCRREVSQALLQRLHGGLGASSRPPLGPRIRAAGFEL